MNKYCYWCGNPVKNKYCTECGTDTNPPQDVYFLDEECGECNARLPRWSRYCPQCRQKFNFYDPTDKANKANHNKDLKNGLIFWSLISIIIACIIPIVSDTIAFHHTLPVSAIILLIFWSIYYSRTERGKYIDGTVTELYTKNEIQRERSLYKTTIIGRPVYYDVPVTVYFTKVCWDNGKEEIIKRDCIAADHIQLKPGDRLRFLIAKRKYQKLESNKR